VLSRASYDLIRFALRLLVQLWPLWLFRGAWSLSAWLWSGIVVPFVAGVPAFGPPLRDLALFLSPTGALLGPVALLGAAVILHRNQFVARTVPFAAASAVAIATLMTAWPEWQRLSPYLKFYPVSVVLGGVSYDIRLALALGLAAALAGAILATARPPLGTEQSPGRVRAPSDNHGHADWLGMKEARALFPGPDPVFGGIVVGEAYRVDQDRVARLAFDPANPRTWGKGGTAPLLVDPCRTGPTHALVVAGSGGYKTTSVAVPTLLTWRGSTVVLDPSREAAPMVTRHREQAMGHQVVTLDPAQAGNGGGSFNALDWIDPASPLAESHVEAVVGWISGEARSQITSGGEFFRESGKGLIACLMAHMLWDPSRTPGEKTLHELRRLLVLPEDEMRKQLVTIHQSSHSSMARDLAGTLKGLVAETFSGVYANANKDTRWLSTPAYAALVSGDTFETAKLADGELTVFVQIPLGVLKSTPALGRVVVGSLLNAAYEADGQVRGRILFLLDEVARLGYMQVLEQARDAGRKYGITLLLLYQSLGQLAEQWGREGKQAWYDSTSWRLFAAVQDPDTAKELSAMCGEHGVVATSLGESAGTQGRLSGGASASSGRSENRAEIKRALIKPDELLQDTRADEAFVIVRGARPLRCGRAVWFRRPDWAGLVGANRFHRAATGSQDAAD